MFKTMAYADLKGNYALVDVRSPKEYKAYTIPGAINIPLFDNEEREAIGTVYTKISVDTAKKMGMEFAAKRLPQIYDSISMLRSQYNQIILFCERGGMRSSSLCSLFNSVGLGVIKLSGGYKGYRETVNRELPQLSAAVKYAVLHGFTGVGKTELLWLLRKKDMDVLDLEAAANHRGSLLGDVGLKEKVSQKHFEAIIYETLRKHRSGLVFIEAESSRIGHIVVPTYIMNGISGGYHIMVEGSQEARIRRIVEEYTKEAGHETDIKSSLEKLNRHISMENINRFMTLLDQKRYEEVVNELIIKYYDPLYIREQKKFSYDLIVNSDDIAAAGNAIEDWMKDKVNTK